MKTILIFVDNFRIGGSQRIAFDQAFEFADRGNRVVLISMGINQDPSVKGLAEIENQNLVKKSIKVISLHNHSFLSNFKEIRNVVKSYSDADVYLSHNLRATFFLRAAKGRFKNSIFATFLHQMPTFASKKQALQRFAYSQLTNHLFIYSQMALEDWQLKYRLFSTLKLPFKSPKLLRNGIYLGRLPNPIDIKQLDKAQKCRLIFLGRPVQWKNYDFSVEYFDSKSRTEFTFVYIIPNLTRGFQNFLDQSRDLDISVITEKTIESIEFFKGDIHVYLTNYGAAVKSGESISINCLEMAAIGIPSVVSRFSKTWADLFELGIFQIIEKDDSKNLKEKLMHLHKKRFDEQIKSVRELVSIKHQCEFIQNL